ncbi:replication-associated recombination protein A [Gleimia sp. 6138-11-ORH1]|uniref:replication-associated recombination protein A n=1 Tax=Gleimia sp. 6138-11-ORH1 TaxID=2973937 RepID=UPI00216A3B8B|nr:replication-associated recombination protein A [Gleimia sp. 6138-11-ORH1]MCS4484395.1 replication-associated recombination protein A [Gleimia sp. 6138-11-ORH1]
MDIFDSAVTTAQGIPQFTARAPLAARMRPKNIDQIVGQQHLLTPGSPLRRLLEPADPTKAVTSVILWGPPGVGKTTLAYLMAESSGREFAEVSAVSGGVKEVREVIAHAKRLLATEGKETILFIDEVHRFSKSQQDSLLPAVENRWVTLVAATTENPSFSVIGPLLSRSILLTLNPLTDAEISTLLDRALKAKNGLDNRVSITTSAKELIVRLAGADARRSLTILEAAAQTALDDERTEISEAEVVKAADVALINYGEDGHYDVTSAFIKSMRGSDVDAAIHYLARMLEAGEDPRYIARRIMICASEDVGMADPTVLPLTVSAAQAVQLIGMPEARIILAQAVVAVATAPKSNAAYLAIDTAIADIRAGKSGQVPLHLRDGHYAGAKELGHGQGYLYAHEAPYGVVAQEYLPESLRGRQYYQPTTNGYEGSLTKRLEKIRSLLKIR